jgi:hypothetical protein
MPLLEFKCQVEFGLVSGFGIYEQYMHAIFMFGHFLFVGGGLAFLIRELTFSFDRASIMIDVLGLFISIFPVLSV